MSMSLSDIARLTGVQRPVVSMWRTRYRDSGHPFPTPLEQRGDRNALLFEDGKVIEWLQATGRGNNPDAHVESALHDDRLTRLLTALDSASSLLLLQHLTGDPVTGTAKNAVREALLLADAPRPLLDPDLLTQCFTDTALMADVDAVAEAAFTAENALAHLVPRAAVASGTPILAPAALRLVTALLREIQTEADLPLVPLDSRSVHLVAQTLTVEDSGTRRHLVALADRLTTPAERAAWRLLLTRGHHVTVTGADSAAGEFNLPAAGCLAVTLLDSTTDQTSLSRSLDEVLLALGPTDRALVLGPASLLVAAGGKADRLALLNAADASEISLRYAAQLPKGFEPSASRRRLAVWLLAGRTAVGSPESTVLADHGDAVVDDAFLEAVATDVATTFSGSAADLADHAFRAGRAARANEVRRRNELTPPSQGTEPSVLGGPLITQVLNSTPELFARLAPAAHQIPTEQHRVTWAQLTRSFGQDWPGLRLPAGELTDSGPGTVAAIGPEELRGTLPWEGRRIHRLRLEEITSRARFTEVGDVVYVSAGGPTARVDDVGGHLVLAPARIFRAGNLSHIRPETWVALPQIVAADIERQRVPDKDAWRIRLSPAARGSDARRVQRVTAARRAALQDELARLQQAEQALLDGLAAGALWLDEGKEEEPEQYIAASAAEKEEA